VRDDRRSPTGAADPVAHGAPTTGLAVLHLFLRAAGPVDVDRVLRAEEDARKAGAQVVAAAMLGHKADVGIMALSADPWQLRRLQSELAAAGLCAAWSYLSLTEVSEYAAGVPEEMRQARLYPQLPPEGKPAFCFYPMSKRRGDVHNWYSLGFDERRELMMGHGKVGRTFHGRILQVITGSTGLDDWEWGVTLFGTHVDDLKDCVYSMRFDEGSALFAEFGPFYTGMVGDLADVLASVVPG
jgi:hydrogen peroxide-dependent heme synthase